jgi:hypothetical protein
LYQALPNTKKALAMVCSSKHAGSRWCKDKDGHSKVPQLYLDAAAAYLDSDQLNDAQMMLVEADSADSSVKNSSQFAPLQQIIDTRLFIASKSIAKPAQEMLPLENDPDHQWIYKGSLAGLDKNFIQRQQFKALSDLALKVKSLKHPGTAKSIQDRIIATIPKKVIIEKPDTADRLRLEKLFPMS